MVPNMYLKIFMTQQLIYIHIHCAKSLALKLMRIYSFYAIKTLFFIKKTHAEQCFMQQPPDTADTFAKNNHKHAFFAISAGFLFSKTKQNH